MNFITLAKKRHSVRNFSDKPVEQRKLDKLLEAALVAPTAKNFQPQRIYVLQSEEALAKLDELTHCRYGAKTVLLFTYDADEDWKNPLESGVHSGIEDVSILATHAMLEAAEIGLATCWCNYFPNSKLAKSLRLPDAEKPVLIMPIGYEAASSKASSSHSESKDVSEIVKYL